MTDTTTLFCFRIWTEKSRTSPYLDGGLNQMMDDTVIKAPPSHISPWPVCCRRWLSVQPSPFRWREASVCCSFISPLRAAVMVLARCMSGGLYIGCKYCNHILMMDARFLRPVHIHIWELKGYMGSCVITGQCMWMQIPYLFIFLHFFTLVNLVWWLWRCLAFLKRNLFYFMFLDSYLDTDDMFIIWPIYRSSLSLNMTY